MINIEIKVEDRKYYFRFKERRELKEIMRLNKLKLKVTDEDIIQNIENQINLCKCLWWKDYIIMFRVY